MTQIEREEEALERDFNEGRMSRKEYSAAMRDLQRAEYDARREQAQDAYDRALNEEW